MDFDWDDEKAKANVQKHGVSFVEASSVFGDPLAITVDDLLHSDDEERYITVGTSDDGRLLIVSHTLRDAVIRIISARRTTRRERKDYEDGGFP